MRTYGALNPIDQIPQPPDMVHTLLIESSSGQALDWGSTQAQLVRLTGMSTAGVAMNFLVSLKSTKAAVPSSGMSTGSTSGDLPGMVVIGQLTAQIPAGSTCFSVAALSSGYIRAEVWKK
jgi:hypothetical protein